MKIIERFKNWISVKENQKKLGIGALLSLGAVTCYKVGKNAKKDEYNVQLYMVPRDLNMPVKIAEEKLK